MESINLKDIINWYACNFESNLSGLRILIDDIEPLIHKLSSDFNTEILGNSEKGSPIYKITIGSGKKRILIWSQMHGNESTGTKVVFDLFKFFTDSNVASKIKEQILTNCTLVFIPMLNPDGAFAYSRENANDIDLNRDAVDLIAVESVLLRSVLDEFKPDFCLNLHDQRTIFNVEGTKNPATLSFLAPSVDVKRSITQSRKETMSVIVSMNSVLQEVIPNQIGRYTDEFYPTATGDNFQKLGHNTILIEAGHFAGDYERDEIRKFNFIALLEGMNFIAQTNDYSSYKSYFDIPNNDSKFFDVIYNNAIYTVDGEELLTDLGVLYKYKLVDNQLERYESVEKVGDLNGFFGHLEIDLKNKHYNP